ncbi:hypothetical protein CK203_101759 [Vitis vinifera]|uniref:Uncharacterized protein n=1 Tax=Vitis vinifera TaxID=29760 RepID=A0A438FB26_VITVI|nr:hypothetical protein CK203_101759 [Vitis vinifera]
MLSKKSVRRDDSNKVVWKDAKKGIIFNQIFYAVLEVGRVVLLLTNIIWNSWVSSKVSFFVREDSWERVLALDNLQKKCDHWGMDAIYARSREVY